MTATESMGIGARPKTPMHLWIVGVLALLWNFMGAFDYLATQLKLESYMGNFSEEQLEYFYGIPAWAVSGWAFAVWIGLVGTVGLCCASAGRSWAFAVSLVRHDRELDLHGHPHRRRHDERDRGSDLHGRHLDCGHLPALVFDESGEGGCSHLGRQ